MEITEHKKNKKYIFVTGGVVSGLGKGITAASLGRLLKARGLKIVAQKLDPYINVDPGTMSPYQHGEVYVTEDGAETDLTSVIMSVLLMRTLTSIQTSQQVRFTQMFLKRSVTATTSVRQFR